MQFIYKTNEALKDLTKLPLLVHAQSVWVAGDYRPPFFADLTVRCVKLGGNPAYIITYIDAYKDAVHDQSTGVMKLYDINIPQPVVQEYTTQYTDSLHKDGVMKLYDVDIPEPTLINYQTSNYNIQHKDGVMKLYDVNIDEYSLMDLAFENTQDSPEFIIRITKIETTIASIE